MLLLLLVEQGQAVKRRQLGRDIAGHFHGSALGLVFDSTWHGGDDVALICLVLKGGVMDVIERLIHQTLGHHLMDYPVHRVTSPMMLFGESFHCLAPPVLGKDLYLGTLIQRSGSLGI